MRPTAAVRLLALLFLSTLARCTVFLDPSSAARVLRPSTRGRRANAFALEELLPGDLERECYEETCSQEEAAEIFHTKEKTLEFWFRYVDRNPCRTDPCQNGGMCTVERGAFMCLCPPRYSGKTCESEVTECRHRNGGCWQYCADVPGGVECGCADGYELEPDGRRCSQTAAFPCGRKQSELLYWARSPWNQSALLGAIRTPAHNRTEEQLMALNASQPQHAGNQTAEPMTPRVVGGYLEEQGGSPWQVLLRRADGSGFCGGTLISDQWVVSAAHCMQGPVDHVTVGDYDKLRAEPGEQQIQVQKVLVHPHFHAFTFDSDVALLRLARPVLRGPTAAPACLPDPHLSKYLLRRGSYGKVTGWGATRHLGRSSRFLRRVTLPVVSFEDCRASTEQVITDNMFCAGYLDASVDACRGDSGGPFVVNYRGTWFLTGVVSWGEGCAAEGKFGVYTRLGNFLNWITSTVSKVEANRTQSGGLPQQGSDQPWFTCVYWCTAQQQSIMGWKPG
ncbi:unnamed protein product [Tetraodon nigroviridis]|uniref:(spotted green pufferfish) hypothetical protein n=1 Tax=Tetraodon nigroviridis TaxID=99883 RepID=Q4SB52_TETNG|nr:unnamed protein product [Tetraodon nigroviridis]